MRKYRPWRTPNKQLTISLSITSYDKLQRISERENKSKSLVIEELISKSETEYASKESQTAQRERYDP